MNILNKMARDNGFADTAEMNEMIARVDISTPHKLILFKLWQYGDGSRTGLLQLMEMAGQLSLLEKFAPSNDG